MLDLLSKALVDMIARGRVARNQELLMPDELLAKARAGDPEVPMLAREWIAEELARRIADAWDRHGAPSVVKDTQNERFVAYYETPWREANLEASSKREAYRQARTAWLKEILLAEG
ncbi:hypothetical protein KZX47_11645 [Thermus sp. SYSU G05001]|uniref:Uncharacterized protein n=1 Tax=Thermus brevis TaxID=2862456 RepID=A0ABS7A0Y6_9DEIN|nr:hypothetical protein [Thermus brevis]MBW6395798.1 hypothetical protein [Thermus brevis]